MVLEKLNPKLFFFALIGELIIFAVFVAAVWFGDTLAYGAAYWALLSAFVTLVTIKQFQWDLKSESLTIKPRQPKIVIGCALLALTVSLAGFLATVVKPPENGADIWAKPIFLLFTTLAIAFFLYVNLKAGQGSEDDSRKSNVVHFVADEAVPEKSDEDEDGESNGKQKNACSTCCPICLKVFLFLIIFLAGTHTVIFVVYKKINFPGNNVYKGQEEFLVNVQDTKIFFRCAGEGSPPVIMHHGWQGNSLDFSWIQAEVSKTTRTCSFDRPGYGHSVKFGKLPRTSEQIAIETEAGLAALGFTDDVIFVGHSFAGFNMRKFNDLFPGRIKGMVMVDTVNPNNTDECDNPDEDADVNLSLYEIGKVLSDTGIMRLFELFGLIGAVTGATAELPEEVQKEYNQHLNRPGFYQTIIEERTVWGKSCASFPRTGPGSILDFPLTVVIPEKGIFEDDLSLGQEQADLSPNGKFVLQQGDDSFHTNAIFQEKYAKIVIQETLEIIEIVRNTTNVTSG
mmetsp:Transcript_9294/g.12091  ORF Transcript_9294/g.12091 Transcript_9294/m.12091 type:complete len:511 (-) Transcript_9294:610-2142(-)